MGEYLNGNIFKVYVDGIDMGGVSKLEIYKEPIKSEREVKFPIAGKGTFTDIKISEDFKRYFEVPIDCEWTLQAYI